MNKKLKIEDSLMLDGIIKIFEKESPVANLLIDLKVIMGKIVLIIVIVSLMLLFINNVFGINIFNYLFILIISVMLYKEIIYSYYNNSKEIGGRKSKFFNIKESIESLNYNLKVMKKQELTVLKHILKNNQIYNTEILKEIRSYYNEEKNKKNLEITKIFKELISVYITVIFGIISIYTSLNLGINVEVIIVNILNIVAKGFVLLVLVMIVYVIFKIKDISITYFYTYSRLSKLLTELIILNMRNKKRRL